MLKPPNWHQNKEYVRVIILEAFCYKGGLEKIMSRWSKKRTGTIRQYYICNRYLE